MKVLKRLQNLNNQIGGTQHVWKQNVFIRNFSTASGPVNTFNAGIYINPHYAKKHKGGEDAACMTESMLAVADGVGGWAESGVDPAIYSKRLCALIEELHATGNDRYIYAPKELLVDAVKQNTEIGSCTCVIVTLDAQSPVIQTVNLGDSGYMILRRESMKDEL